MDDLANGRTDEQLSEDLANYNELITEDFEPAVKGSITKTYDVPKIRVTAREVESALRKIKKPKGTVPGDVPWSTVNKIAGIISQPLAQIYNRAFSCEVRPPQWKNEFETIIPKVNAATEFNECRNITCTSLFSKIMETFVLERLREEIPPLQNQYGGTKGCSVEHFFIETWDTILEHLEGEKSAVNVASVDFSKAFNRVDHMSCLQSLADLEESNQSLEIICDFLNDRSTDMERDRRSGK